MCGVYWWGCGWCVLLGVVMGEASVGWGGGVGGRVGKGEGGRGCSPIREYEKSETKKERKVC